jgi:hypothetical protein
MDMSRANLLMCWVGIQLTDSSMTESHGHSRGFLLTARLEDWPLQQIDIAMEFPPQHVFSSSHSCCCCVPLVRFMSPVAHHIQPHVHSVDGYFPPSLLLTDSHGPPGCDFEMQLHLLMSQLAAIAEYNIRVMGRLAMDSPRRSRGRSPSPQCSSPAMLSSQSQSLVDMHDLDPSLCAGATPSGSCVDSGSPHDWLSPAGAGLDLSVACRLQWPHVGDDDEIGATKRCRRESSSSPIGLPIPPPGEALLGVDAVAAAAAKVAAVNYAQYQLFMCCLYPLDKARGKDFCCHCGKRVEQGSDSSFADWSGPPPNPLESRVCQLTHEALRQSDPADTSRILARLVQLATAGTDSLHPLEYQHAAVAAAYILKHHGDAPLSTHLCRGAALLLLLLHQRATVSSLSFTSGRLAELLLVWIHRMGVCRHRLALWSAVPEPDGSSQASSPPMLVSLMAMSSKGAASMANPSAAQESSSGEVA